jgi:transposase-like protein
LGKKKLDANCKAEIALEALKGNKKISELAQQHDVSVSMIRKYKKKLLEYAPSLFSKEVSARGGNKEMEKKSIENEKKYTKLKLKMKKIGDLVKENAFVFSTLIMALLTGLLVYFNAKMAHYTDKMANYTAEMACYTSDTSRYTSDMAQSTKDLTELSKNPTLYIYCLIRSDFNFSISDGIQFEAADYLYNNKRANFYIAVANKWGSNINDEMDIEFKISILDNEKYPVKIENYKINDFRIALGPEDITEISPVQEINKKLSGGDFNWQNSNSFKIIQVEIKNSSVEVRHYPYAGVKVKYFGYDDFIKKYEEFKKRNNKEI